MASKPAASDWQDLPDEKEEVEVEEITPLPDSKPRRSAGAAPAPKGRHSSDDGWGDLPDEHTMSEMESVGRGALSGASMDFDDEIVGKVKSLLGPKKYEEYRDEWRNQKKQAQEDNPNSFLGGELGGAIGSGLLLPGGAVAEGAGVLSKIGRAAMAGAAYGGLSGAGASEHSDLPGIAEDAGRGAAAGAATGGLVSGGSQLAGKALGAVGKIGNIAEKGYKALGEISDEVAEKIKQNPTIVRQAADAKTSGALAEGMSETVNRLQEKLRGMSDKAWEPLIAMDSKGITVPGPQLASSAADIADKYNLWGKQAAQQGALKKLRAAAEDTAEVESFQGLKRVIQAIDENIDWDKPGDQLSNTVLQSYRTALDQRLKAQIPQYRVAMAPLAETADAIQTLTSKFGLKKGSQSIGADIRPTMLPSDRTISSLETATSQALAEKGGKTRQMMQKLAPDMLTDIEAAGMNKYLDRDIGRGSRSTVVGSALGWLFGSPIAGAAAGYLRDKEGRQIAAKGLASLAEKSAYVRSKAQNLGGPVGNAIESAFKRGGNAAVMVTAKMLAERNAPFANELSKGPGDDADVERP